MAFFLRVTKTPNVSELIRRAAVGRIALLGDLYDVRTDQFCGVSLYGDNLPSSAVKVIDSPLTKTEFIYKETVDEKFRQLNVNAELGISLLSGFVQSLQMAVGGNVNYSSSDTLKATNFTFKLHGDLLPKTGGAIPTSFDEACQYLQQLQTLIQKANNGKGKPVEFTLFPLSDPGLRTQMSCSPEVAQRRITEISEADSSRFVKLFDRIISIRQKVGDLVEDMHHSGGFTNMELGEVESMLSNIEEGENELRLSLRNLLRDVRSGNKNVAELKSLYDSYDEKETFLFFANKKYKEWLNRAQTHIEFNQLCQENGVRYVQGDKSINEIINNIDDVYVLYADNKSIMSDSKKWEDNKTIFIQKASEIQNEQKKHQVSLSVDSDRTGDQQRVRLVKLCLFVNCNFNSGLASEVGIRIRHYRNGQVRCDDFAIDVSKHRSMNVARSTVKPEAMSDEDEKESSEQRSDGDITVLLRCPGSSTPETCSNEKRNWSCDVCRQPLYLNVTDNRFRCKCGYADPYSFHFRCSDSTNHRYDNYVEFDKDQLRRQLRALNPSKGSKSPTLKHVIPSDGRQVASLTFINNELFVLRHPSKEEIQVYETATFTQQRTVRVAGLSDDGLCKTLTSCDVNECLFVCDLYNVYKVDLSTDNVNKWRVYGWPSGLSVNDARHVIVTCNYGNEIREYEQNGRLIRTIKLREQHVTAPWQAVQIQHSQFIVSHRGPVDGVSLIDAQGIVLATYRNSKSTQLLNAPRQITVGKNGSILVVDNGNNRLVVLDASLKNARELTLPIDRGLNGPLCLNFNESLGQLYVGEYRGQHVVLYDNISLE